LWIATNPRRLDFGAVTVIDCHVHLYPPEINGAAPEWAAQAGEAVWAALCTRRRRNGRAVQGFPDTAELLQAMDEAGVARALLLGWYWETPAACALQNRFYADCVRKHPDRLSACLTVQPGAGAAALAELRWGADNGFVGVGELSPHSHGLSADDWRWHDILALAGELGLPVNLHVTDPQSRAYPGRVETPLDDFVAWARQHPGTTFVLAHGGGLLPWQRPEVRALQNVYYDTAAYPLLYPLEHVTEWCAELGSDRLLWGSDWPLDLYPREAARPPMAGFRAGLDALALTPEARAALMGGNAARIFRLPGI
jgi:uncharacterized protein